MIRSLTIRNLLGISALELSIAPSGALIEGGNGRGKTSVMRALKAGLDGAGISADAVRRGETAAEIVIDLDHESVRRKITAAGKTTLDVEDAHGVPRKRPAEFLSALLGLALLDPLDLYLSKPGERRAQILRAVPCTLTPEMVNAVLPDWHATVNADDCEGHGIEALAAIRENVAGYRTALSRKVKDAREEQRLAEARVADHSKVLAAFPAIEDGAGDRLRAATEQLGALSSQKLTADRQARAAAHQRAKADALRSQAADIRGAAPDVPTEEERLAARDGLQEANVALRAINTRLEEQRGKIRELEARLEAERDKFQALSAEANRAINASDDATAVHEMLQRREADAKEHAARADALELQADELLATVAALTSEAPSDEALAAAAQAKETAMREAERTLERERLRAAAESVAAAAAEKKSTADAIAAKHAQLDASVKALTDDLPAQLLAGAGEALHGLAFDGDRVLVKDQHGETVSLDTLNTAQQMAFALGVAKKLNTKSKILLVDGLERIDDEQRREFVALAIENGYQLFATRVTSGPLSVRPIGEAVSQ